MGLKRDQKRIEAQDRQDKKASMPVGILAVKTTGHSPESPVLFINPKNTPMTVTRHHSLTDDELLRLVDDQRGNELVVELGDRFVKCLNQQAEIGLLQEQIATLIERAERAEDALNLLS